MEWKEIATPSNKLKKLELILEFFGGIQKHAGKVRKLGFLIIFLFPRLFAEKSEPGARFLSNINRGCIITAKQVAASMMATNANLQPSKLKSSSVRIVHFLIALIAVQYDYGVKYF